MSNHLQLNHPGQTAHHGSTHQRAGDHVELHTSHQGPQYSHSQHNTQQPSHQLQHSSYHQPIEQSHHHGGSTVVRRSSITREAPGTHSHRTSITRAAGTQPHNIPRPSVNRSSVTRKSITGHVRQPSHSHVRTSSQLHEVPRQGSSHHSRQPSSHVEVRNSRQGSLTRAPEHQVHHSHHHSNADLQESRHEERRSITKDEAQRGDARLMDSHVCVGDEKIISENVLDCIEQSRVPRDSTVRNCMTHDPKCISESIVSEKITNEYTNPMREPRKTVTPYKNQTVDIDIDCHRDDVEIVERQVEKIIEVIIEKAVPNYVEVEVDVPIYIENVVERVIEKEVITEIIMETVTDTIMEVPVEIYVDKHIEKNIEKEVLIEEIIEIPVTRIIEEEVEYIIEQPIINEKIIEIPVCDIHLYHDGEILPTRVTTESQQVDIDCPVYVENIIEKEIPHYIENIVESVVHHEVEHHVEHHVDVPVYIDNIIYHDIEREVCNRVEVQVDSGHVHRQPIYRENIVHHEVPVECQVVHMIEKEVVHHIEREIPCVHEVHHEVWCDVVHEIEHVIEKPIYVDNIIDKPIYIEHIIERPVERCIEQYVEYEVIEEVEVVHVCYQDIEVPCERIIEHEIIEHIEHHVERIVSKPVYIENIIEKEVICENIIEIECEKLVEVPVYKENRIEKEIFIEKCVEVPYENVIEKIVTCEVERLNEVEVEVIVERPVTVDKYIEKPVYIEKVIEKPTEVIKYVDEVVDVGMTADLEECKSECEYFLEFNQRLCVEEELMKEAVQRIHGESHEDYYGKCKDLRRQIGKLEADLALCNKRQSVREKKQDKITTIYYLDDPKAEEMKERVNHLKAKNHTLSQQIGFHEKRINVGTHNYANSKVNVVDSETGRVVQERRTLRKSNKHIDNSNVTISTVTRPYQRGSHVESQVIEQHRTSVQHQQATLVTSQIVRKSHSRNTEPAEEYNANDGHQSDL